LGTQGQALQARFIDGYADELRSDIQDQLVLTTGQPIARPNVTSASDVRASSSVNTGSDFRPDASNLGVAEIRNEVADAQIAGRTRIGKVNNYLDGITKEAKGASEKSADDVKEWK
jgi:conjugal transfer mating pair stabilization protein TraG